MTKSCKEIKNKRPHQLPVYQFSLLLPVPLIESIRIVMSQFWHNFLPSIALFVPASSSKPLHHLSSGWLLIPVRGHLLRDTAPAAKTLIPSMAF